MVWGHKIILTGKIKKDIIMSDLSEQSKRPAKTIAESRTEQQYLIRPAHMLRWIDELAGIVARRHANANITTAAIDNLQFKAPVYAGQMLVLVGHVTYVGSTSMEVRVDTYTEDLDGMRHVINRAYIVMVAIDDNGKPITVPDIIIDTAEDRMEYEAAKKRRDMRKLRRAEGF